MKNQMEASLLEELLLLRLFENIGKEDPSVERLNVWKKLPIINLLFTRIELLLIYSH